MQMIQFYRLHVSRRKQRKTIKLEQKHWKFTDLVTSNVLTQTQYFALAAHSLQFSHLKFALQIGGKGKLKSVTDKVISFYEVLDVIFVMMLIYLGNNVCINIFYNSKLYSLCLLKSKIQLLMFEYCFTQVLKFYDSQRFA